MFSNITIRDKIIALMVIMVVVFENIFNMITTYYVYNTVDSNISITVSESKNINKKDPKIEEMEILQKKVSREAWYIILACYLEPILMFLAKGFEITKNFMSNSISNEHVRIGVKLVMGISMIINIIPLYAGIMKSSKVVEYIDQMFKLF